MKRLSFTLALMAIVYPSQYIEVIGTIIDRFADTAFRAELPNGKVTVAFVERKNAQLKDELTAGDKVLLRICPADFDCARIESRI